MSDGSTAQASVAQLKGLEPNVRLDVCEFQVQHWHSY